MAAPDRAGRDAARHEIHERLERLRHGLGQRLAGRRIETVPRLSHLADIGGHRMAVIVGRAEARGDGGQPVMELRHARAERGHQFGRQRAARRHAVEQPLLVEAPHHHQPVDRVSGGLADLAQRQLAVTPHHRGDAEIDFRGRSPVHVDLGGAHRGAPGLGREVHVGELHGPLQLVGALPAQEDDGAVRVDLPLRLQLGLEEGNRLGLVLDDEGRTHGHGCLVRSFITSGVGSKVLRCAQDDNLAGRSEVRSCKHRCQAERSEGPFSSDGAEDGSTWMMISAPG